MKTEDIKELLSLMACVCCSEIDGSMCQDYVHQVNNALSQYSEDVKDHFIECWITVARCVHVNNLNEVPKYDTEEYSYCDKIYANIPEENNLEVQLQQLVETSNIEKWLNHIGENYVEFAEPGQGIQSI